MHCHIRCICSTFLCCVLLNVCSKRLHKRMQIHIGCICLTLTHCAFANVLSKHIHKKIFNYTRCICLTFLDCAFRFVLLNVWEDEDEPEKSQHNIGILSVESYSCRSHHHCHCHHRQCCCHRHRHLHCHQYKQCCVIFHWELVFCNRNSWSGDCRKWGRGGHFWGHVGGWNYGTTWPTKAFGSWISRQVFCGSKYALQIQTNWIFGAKMGQFFVW